MAVPALRVPLGLDMQSYEKSINEAKALTSRATDFLVQQFAKTQLKLVVDQKEFRPAIEGAARFAGQQFDKVRPQIQAFTQTAVKETTEAGLKVASVFAGPAIKGSFQAFTAVGVPAATGLAQALLPVATRALAAYAAFELLAGAVGAAREQIAQMVAVADKAGDRNVSPKFLQLFESEARKLKVSTEELDTALANAFNASKEKSPIDLAKWEVAGERITDVELALRVYNAEIEKATGKRLEGLVLFRDAQTQDDKVKAILKSMVELEATGRRLQALELGEKFFGTQLVDRIRQGKTSAESMLETIERLNKSQDGIFSDAIVARAKAIDDQLKLSQDRLSRALKPSWEELAGVVLTIKGYWADVVGLIASAAEAANRIKVPDGLLKAARDAALGAVGATPVVGPLVTAARVAAGFVPERPATFAERFGSLPPATTRAPSRGTGAAPTLRATEGQRDPFEAAIDQAEKRIAVLTAEAGAIDDTTAARERAKLVAQLEEAAKRANSAAGKENTEVTEQQRAAIEAEARALEAAVAALERARVASQIRFAQGTAFLSQSDVAIAQQLKGLYPDVATALASVEAAGLRTAEATRSISGAVESGLTQAFSSLGDRAQTLEQRLVNAWTNIAGAIEQAIVKLLIVGPLMRALQGGLGEFLPGLSGGAGAPLNLLPGQNADGSDYWRGGLTWVGERGPELLNVPRGAQIVPNDVARARGGGDVTVNLVENSGRAGQVERRDNGSGGFDLTVFVDSIMAKNVANPGSATRQTLKSAGRLVNR